MHTFCRHMTTGTLCTICVLECGLLGTVSGRCGSEMLMGTDVPLSMSVALFRPLAMIVLRYTLGQAYTE
jgi:hypothetical protein